MGRPLSCFSAVVQQELKIPCWCGFTLI
uniref:Uncharacterized protein n=1 Tax=Arundo donax TaxID=35708 RepID=A0A0A9B6S7_ARUDO